MSTKTEQYRTFDHLRNEEDDNAYILAVAIESNGNVLEVERALAEVFIARDRRKAAPLSGSDWEQFDR